MSGSAVSDPVYFETQDAFHDWLDANPNAREIWVGYFKKSTGRASLSWSESVDVALCFGWIDGIRKTVDAERYKIRFTPRKLKSVWSAVNVKKVQELTALGKMRPAGLHVYENRSDAKGYTSADRNMTLSEEYEDQIKANPAAWAFFSDLAPSYKRETIWFVMSAKREETRLKRLGILIESSGDGQKIPSLRKT